MVKQEVIAYLKEGKSNVEIAELYGISRQRVQQYISNHCLAGHRRRKPEEVNAYFEWLKKWGAKETTEKLLYQAQRQKWRTKKANAKRDNVPFDLPFGAVVWPERCPLLDIPLDYFTDGITVATPTFDRYDPTKGYVEGNVWIISMKANAIKSNYQREDVPEFFAKMDKIFSSLDTPYTCIFQESMVY